MNTQENDRLVKLFPKESALITFKVLRQEFKGFDNGEFCAMAGIGPAFMPGNLIAPEPSKGLCREELPTLSDTDTFCLTEAGKNWRYRWKKERRAAVLAYLSCVLSSIAAIAAVASLIR